MNKPLLIFVEEQVNPTVGEIIAEFGCDIRSDLQKLLKEDRLFSFYDEYSGYSGEYRIINDKQLT